MMSPEGGFLAPASYIPAQERARRKVIAGAPKKQFRYENKNWDTKEKIKMY